MKDTNNPLVSVCIPAYNNADYIHETIECVLGQTYQNIQLIICDDCSKDQTVEVVKKYDDPRIQLFENEKNLGMSGNWNHCLSKCSGEYIKLICADDMLAKDAIEKEVNAFLNNPEVLLVESDTQFRDLNGKTKGYYRRYKKSGVVEGKTIGRACLFSRNLFGAPLNNMFKRSVLEKIHGFDTSFVYILDYDFFMSIACLGKVYIIHEPLNYFRLRNDSNTGKVLTTEQKAYVTEHKMLLKKHQKELNINRFEYAWSVMMRHILNAGARIYLRLFIGKS